MQRRNSGSFRTPEWARVAAVARYLPKTVVSNQMLHEVYGYPKPPDWLEKRTGIKSRHFAGEGETTVTMAAQVVKQLIEQAGGNLDVDLLILTTYTGEFACPGGAIMVAEATGVEAALAFDMSAACAGFGAALEMADRCLNTGLERAIVVSAEIHSRNLFFGDYKTAGLFGDGAAGVLLERSTESGIEASARASASKAAGYLVRYHRAPPEEDADARRAFHMPENKKLVDEAAPFMADLARRAVESSKLDLKDFKWVIPHQANVHIIKDVAERLGARPEQVFINVDRIGNCGSATIPLCLSELVDSKQIVRGDLALLISAGTGMTGVAHVLRY